ncbi:MAG: hypothetical protein HYV63_19845 [Candidatus Schekmanbacteria bacterium]|nr:hypothetical protein [Candidatus Schekmanbacteria bacterium]
MDVQEGIKAVLERLAEQDRQLERDRQERGLRYEQARRDEERRHTELLVELNDQRRALDERMGDLHQQAMWAIRESIEQGKRLIEQGQEHTRALNANTVALMQLLERLGHGNGRG